MPIHLYLTPHQKAQVARFTRLLGAFLVSSGVADSILSSSWLRAAVGGSAAAGLEVLWRQIVKVQPPQAIIPPVK